MRSITGTGEGGTPYPHWPANSTQYGMLKKIRVDRTGTYIDEKLASDISISAVGIEGKDLIPLRIGIKEDARYVAALTSLAKSAATSIRTSPYW